jgi:predicted TIM-barrel fold metal-dependent hydrolase
VCLLAADYGLVVGLVHDYASQLSAPAQAKLFGGNAAKFYRRR